MTDPELVERVIAGCQASAETLLVDRCGRAIAYLAWTYRWDDLLGELYVHLAEDGWRRLSTWKGESSIRTWVSQVATRLCIRHSQENRREWSLDGLKELGMDMPDILQLEAMEQGIARLELLKAIDRLANPNERLVLRLHIIEQMDLEDVARRTGLSRANVDTHKHRATRKLCSLLGKEVPRA